VTTYISQIDKKKFTPNLVLRFKELYWSIRQPDSGLIVDHSGLLDQVVINPTRVDPFQANTTINSYSFTLLDKDMVVTSLFNGVTSFFQNELVEIWVGRSGVGMDFSEYFKLPETLVTGVSRDNSTYKFSSTEAKNRIDRPAFNEVNALAVNILPNTTVITASIPFPVSAPSSGFAKVGAEFFSYSGLDTVNNRFLNCIRGEKNSIPSEHDAGEEIFLVNDVTGNPIDILISLLVSSGGGSAYDTLPDGAGVEQELINIESFEEIRDQFFLGQEYTLSLYGIQSILKYVEQEILFPNELRIVTDNSSKIGLAILNRSIFTDEVPQITNDTILKQPTYSATDSEVINTVTVRYDFSEGTAQYRKIVTETDEESQNLFGRREPRIVSVKGVTTEDVAQNIALRFLTRFSFPKPQISLSTQIDKSLINLGNKVELVSNQIPSEFGELNFIDTLEVLERGINWKTGDVRFKIAFTSFTGIRECYLAPSDVILEFIDLQTVRIASGRTALYRVGWKMRIYSELIRDYVDSTVYEITEISGNNVRFDIALDTALADEILLQENGDPILLENGEPILISTQTSGDYRIMFADYDQVSENQKRYCFISNEGNNFYDNRKSYQVTL
jgi:hypothetical protein